MDVKIKMKIIGRTVRGETETFFARITMTNKTHLERYRVLS